MVRLLSGHRITTARGRLLPWHRFGMGSAVAVPVAGTFVGAGNSGLGFSASRTVPAVTDTLPGDIAVAFCLSEHTPSPPDGSWALAGEQRQGTRAIVAYAKALTEPLGPTTWTWSGSHNQAAAVVVYRGVQIPGAAQFAGAGNNNVASVVLSQEVTPDQSIWLTAGYRVAGDMTFGWLSDVDQERVRTGASSHAYSVSETVFQTAANASDTFRVTSGAAGTTINVAVGIVLRPVGVAQAPGVITDGNGNAITDMSGNAIQEAA